MKKRKYSLLVTLSLVLTGLCVSGFDFSPDKWVKDIGKLWERNEPKYQNITFWDFENQTYRGLRVFLYTVPKERENRMVDLRLHRKMAQFLSYMCKEIITLEAFDGSTYEPYVEQKLDRMVMEWKLNGQVQPQAFFEPVRLPSSILPTIDVDIVVLMERVFYDQIWKGDTKLLTIGIQAAVFEMDKGEPLYMDRVMVESPWQGETGTYSKAEHAALLQVADAMGSAIQKKANEINQQHEQLDKQASIARIKQETSQYEQIKEESRRIKDFIEQVESRLNTEGIPKELSDEISPLIEALKPLTKKTPPKVRYGNKPATPPSKNELTPEEVERRRILVADIQDKLKLLDEWNAQENERFQQEAIASQTPLREQNMGSPFNASGRLGVPTTVDPAANMVGIPTIQNYNGNIKNREWIKRANILRTGPIPIAPVTGTIRRPDIQSSSIPSQLPDSFMPFQRKNIPPLPAENVSSSTSENNGQ